MKPKSKRQVVLATWPLRQDYEYFGATPYHMGEDTCESVWLSFRLVNPADKDDYIPYSEADIISDIGLYFWYSTRGSVQMEFKGHAVHSIGVDKCERLLKVLRKYNKALGTLPTFTSDSLALALAGALDSIGVRLAVEYGHGNESYQTAYSAIARIAETLDNRLATLRLNDRNRYPKQEEATA